MTTIASCHSPAIVPVQRAAPDSRPGDNAQSYAGRPLVQRQTFELSPCDTQQTALRRLVRWYSAVNQVCCRSWRLCHLDGGARDIRHMPQYILYRIICSPPFRASLPINPIPLSLLSSEGLLCSYGAPA